MDRPQDDLGGVRAVGRPESNGSHMGKRAEAVEGDRRVARSRAGWEVGLGRGSGWSGARVGRPKVAGGQGAELVGRTPLNGWTTD